MRFRETLRKLPSIKRDIFCFFNVAAKSVDVQLNKHKDLKLFFYYTFTGFIIRNWKKANPTLLKSCYAVLLNKKNEFPKRTCRKLL